MKKLIALLLSLAMVACLFAGCAGDTETPTTEAPTTEAAPTTTAAPTTEGGDEPAPAT